MRTRIGLRKVDTSGEYMAVEIEDAVSEFEAPGKCDIARAEAGRSEDLHPGRRSPRCDGGA